jgi:hypothetical protein
MCLVTITTIFSAAILVKAATGAPGTHHQSPFFKEILMGRCYAQPPTGNLDDIASCPSMVGSIVGVLEGNLDDMINGDSFSTYTKVADFNAGDKGSIFWLKAETDYRTTMTTGGG